MLKKEIYLLFGNINPSRFWKYHRGPPLNEWSRFQTVWFMSCYVKLKILFTLLNDLHILYSFHYLCRGFISSLVPCRLLHNSLLHQLDFTEEHIRGTSVGHKIHQFHPNITDHHFGCALTTSVAVLLAPQIHLTLSLIVTILILIIVVVIKSITIEVNQTSFPLSSDCLNNHDNVGHL